MSMNVTVEGLKKVHGDNASNVFNEISQLSGSGVQASGFNSNEGGIAINSDTPHYDKIKTLIGAKDDKKDGAK